jgi:hypothetical protein
MGQLALCMRGRAARQDRALARGRLGLRPGVNALLGAAHSTEGECGVVEAWAGPQRRLLCVRTPEPACVARGRRGRARRPTATVTHVTVSSTSFQNCKKRESVNTPENLQN